VCGVLLVAAADGLLVAALPVWVRLH
jgi:hypothetical protein